MFNNYYRDYVDKLLISSYDVINKVCVVLYYVQYNSLHRNVKIFTHTHTIYKCTTLHINVDTTHVHRACMHTHTGN